MKSKVVLASLFVAISTSHLAGQDTEVSMLIDVVAWGDDIGGLSFRSGKSEGQIIARAFRYTEPVRYNGPRLLAIHKTGGDVVKQPVLATPEDEEHLSIPLSAEEIARTGTAMVKPVPKELAARREKEPTLVSLVALPANTRRATVLLAPAAEGTYQGYVIDDDPSKLPAGKLRVHNLSPDVIAMRFNNRDQKELAPRESFLVDATNGHAIYQLAYRSGDGWKIQENNIIPVYPEEQTQFIVLKSSNPFFLSADGASGGYLQTVILRRPLKPASTP
jgi:hypothetical protein